MDKAWGTKSRLTKLLPEDLISDISDQQLLDTFSQIRSKLDKVQGPQGTPPQPNIGRPIGRNTKLPPLTPAFTIANLLGKQAKLAKEAGPKKKPEEHKLFQKIENYLEKASREVTSIV